MLTIRPLSKTKVCIGCKIKKSISHFRKFLHKDSPRGFYHYSRCKPCEKNKIKEYAVADRERRNKRLREWRKNNPKLAFELDTRKRIKRLK